MGKPNGKRRNLEQIVEQRKEAVGGEDIEFDFGGEVFSIPHPMFADDEWKEQLAEVGNNDLKFARLALGDQYAKFREVGGRSGYIGLLVNEVMQETQGTTPEGNPTQSSMSSETTPKPSKQTS